MLSRIFNPIKKKYIEYINRKLHAQHQEQEYLEVQRLVHDEILENEHQDTYLMNEDEEILVVKSNGVLEGTDEMSNNFVENKQNDQIENERG